MKRETRGSKPTTPILERPEAVADRWAAHFALSAGQPVAVLTPSRYDDDPAPRLYVAGLSGQHAAGRWLHIALNRLAEDHRTLLAECRDHLEVMAFGQAWRFRPLRYHGRLMGAVAWRVADQQLDHSQDELIAEQLFIAAQAALKADAETVGLVKTVVALSEETRSPDLTPAPEVATPLPVISVDSLRR